MMAPVPAAFLANRQGDMQDHSIQCARAQCMQAQEKGSTNHLLMIYVQWRHCKKG